MSANTSNEKVYTTFKEFYPFYLNEHANPINRQLHFVGTTLVILVGLFSLLTFSAKYVLYMPVIGYGFAWVGHFFFEKNKPATFKYPGFSLRGDFQMWFDIVTGKISASPHYPAKKI